MTVRVHALTLAGLMSLTLAAGCATPGSTASAPASATASRAPQARLSAQALKDPAARFKLMDELERQLIRKTQDVPDAEYPAVRGRLFTQLQGLGLDAIDSEQVLAGVDAARADRARVARWWMRLWSAS